jgi:Glycosyl hydrolase catalytic core
MVSFPFAVRSLSLLVLAITTLMPLGAEEELIIDPAARSPKKGIGYKGSAGVTALPKLQVCWAYSWWHRSYNEMPKLTEYVPMILDAEVLNKEPGAIAKADSYGQFLLGFNEPDHGEPDRVSVETAINLWPKFIATGMRLGSPAMAGKADQPGGWLDQFMHQAEKMKYRVDTICVHAYLDQYDPKVATKKLRDYLEAIYIRYKKPIWLTEFALANYWKKVPATEQEQIAFMAQALPMLEALPFVERYAWFHLGAGHPDALIHNAELCDARGELTRIGRYYRDAVLRVVTKPQIKPVIRQTSAPVLAIPARTITEAWRQRLLERLRTSLAAGKTVTYSSPFLKKPCTVLGISDENQLAVSFDHDSRFELAWAMVDTHEAAALAQALITTHDWAGNAMAAYFILLDGDTVKAAPLLDQSGLEATRLRQLFALDAATPSPGQAKPVAP